MSKRKWYAKAVYLLVALAMTVGLLMVPAVAANGPALGITVDPDGGTIFCGANQPLTVTVSNTGAYAEDVVLEGVVDGPATLSPAAVTLYDICSGCSKEAAFNLTCTGVDGVTVNFTATPTNGDPAVLQVNYEQICRFDVEITAPQDGDIVEVSDTFGVAVDITNNTDDYCEALNVTLNITGEAVQVGGNATYTINLHAGETEEVNWTVHCTAEGEATFTVTAVGCDQSGDCAELCADTVTILQTPPDDCDPVCGFSIEILPPIWDCDEDICVCDEFDVSVNVTNNCDECGGAITGTVEMHATGDAESVPGGHYWQQRGFAGIEPGETDTLTFTWHCYDAGDNCQYPPLDLFQSGVDFEARAWATSSGPGVCYMPSGGWWEAYWCNDTWLDYINQTWIDLKLFDDYEDGNPICTCRDYCVGDDILVYPRVQNCGNVTLKAAEVFFLDMAGNITWEGAPKDSVFIGDIPAGQMAISEEPFHFRCNATGEAWLSFKAAGVYLPVRTVCDIDEVNIHQKEAPKLEVALTAEDCQQYCDNFLVKAVITNTGNATATAIEIDPADIVLTPSGDVEQVSGMECDCCDDGMIILEPNESCNCTWEFHCSGPIDATFIVDVDGVATCGAPLHDSDKVNVEQIQLDIDIITPEECDIKCVSDTFCVTANISDNDPDTCFAGLNATITFPSGKANIEVGENITKAFNLTDGDTQQVSWSVHCNEAGDTDIMVEVTGCASDQQGICSDNCTGAECSCCELHNKFDTITIYQIGRPDLDMEITSPDNLDTFVATSQDFAVTVTIDNNTELSDVTVTDIWLEYDPESGATIVQAPEVPFDILEGETTKVTWTLHCEEPGLLTIEAYATAENEIGCAEEAGTSPLALWQYPAASLEVDILGVEPDTTITVCQDFTVFYQVRNTGAADATDVVAELSVIPGGSARPVEGIGSGYTQRIGTIPAGGETEVLEWNLHCKVACESNIVITVKGNDEYGWHKKQECQSTGNFIIEEGYEYFETLGVAGEGLPQLAWGYGYFEGDASGLIGPFNFDSDFQFARMGGGPDYLGHITGMGVVIPGADGDLMEWVGHVMMDPGYDLALGISTWDVDEGYFQIINGNLSGAYVKTCIEYPEENWETGFLNGTYCSTMAKEALRPINPDFIESDTVTVKQLEPAQLVVEINYPYEGFRTDATEEYDVTATITNIGEETAENVSATLSVDDSASILSPDPPAQDIAGGDSVSVTWEVTCTEAGFSVFTANATGTGAISGNAVEAFDTVTVKQGEVPLAQLVVEISYPENGDEFIEGDQFPVTAWIENVGERTAKDVEVSIDFSANAENVSGPIGWPKNIAPTSSVAATWTVNCTAAGFSVITVEATGNSTENACNTAVDVVTIKQLPPPKPYLTVDVSAPAEVTEGDTYIVTAVVTNEGEADAVGVNATIQITGDADWVVVTPITDATIEVGDQAKAEWRVECTGGEDVNISVEASGDNTNMAIGSVAVMQIAISPYLTVEVSAPAEVTEGDTYIVTAVVTNEGQEAATGVDASIQITGDAILLAVVTPISDATIEAGNQAKAEWRVECTGGEDVNISVEASGDNTNMAIGSVAVKQNSISAFLELELTAPAEIPEDNMFTVCAVLSNTGDVVAEDIDIFVEASDFTDPVGYYTYLAELPAGDSIVFGYDFLCTGEGGVNIAAEALGADTNLAAASIAVQQLAVWEGSYLWVDVTAPVWAYVDDDYYVTAVVSNFGDLVAIDVDASLEINGPASTLDPPVQAIGNIPAGSSADVSWMLTADAQGGVNVIVTAVGTDTNTAVDAAAIQQGVIMWDELVVIPTSGVAPLEITASAKVSNSGDMATTTDAELYVNGEVVASQVVSLGAGAGRIVSFDYVLAAGTYDVTINGLDPVEVIVTAVSIQLYEGANPIEYIGSTADFPAVLTNIGPAGLDVAEIIWLRDTSTGGAWWFYNVPQDYSHPVEFTGMVNGKVYIVVVSEDCEWFLL